MEVVATASHADEALEYVQENPIDIIISDVNMPDKTGLDMDSGDEMKSYQMQPISYFQVYQEFDYCKKEP